MRKIWYCTALTICLAMVATAQTPPVQQPPTQSPQAVEELLGEVDDGALGDGAWQVSPDGRRLAWRTKRDKKWVMIVDGQPGPGFDDVSSAVFSPNGQRLAYAVESNNKWMMVVDGKAGPEFDHLAERQVNRGNRGPWGNAKDPLVWFSSNSKHVAYLARRGKKWFIVIDGRESPPYEDVAPPFFSPDGLHTGYMAKQAGEWRIAVDGKADGLTFDSIVRDGSSPRFEPEGQRLAYVGGRKQDWFAVLDGKEIPIGKADSFWAWKRKCHFGTDARGVFICLPACIAFSKNLRRVAFTDNLEGKARVVVDGQPGATFDWAGCPIFSPDEKHFAYFANRGKANAVGKDQDQFVVAGGQAGPSFKRIIALYFTPDSRISYLAWRDSEKEGRGKVIEVTNGTLREVAEHENMPMLVHLAFSPDSQRVAYVLIDDFGALGFWSQAWRTRPFQMPHKKGRVNLYVDGKPFGKELDVMGISTPVFSPDSRHLAFVVFDHKMNIIKSGSGPISFVVLGSQEGKTYSDVLPETLVFSSPNSVFYVARQGKKFYRVTQTTQDP